MQVVNKWKHKNICNTNNQSHHAMKVVNTKINKLYTIPISNPTMQYKLWIQRLIKRYRIPISNSTMQYEYTNMYNATTWIYKYIQYQRIRLRNIHNTKLVLSISFKLKASTPPCNISLQMQTIQIYDMPTSNQTWHAIWI